MYKIKFVYIFLVLVLIHSLTYAQKDIGIVEYERYYYYINIMSKIPFYTQADIDRERLTWGKNEGKWSENFQLFFKNNKTLYLKKETDANYGYSRKSDNFFLERDLDKKAMKDFITFNDRDYVIEGETVKWKWKILNEIKEVAGYVCMKAESFDPMRNVPVHAWFTSEIPVSGGPEGIGGLPGMILELVFNRDDVVITATNVSFHDSDLKFPYPKKYKGRKITPEEYADLYRKAMERAFKSKENPFWGIRY